MGLPGKEVAYERPTVQTRRSFLDDYPTYDSSGGAGSPDQWNRALAASDREPVPAPDTIMPLRKLRRVSSE